MNLRGISGDGPTKARGIVRQLKDENLAVTRGGDDDGFARARMEPA